MPQLPSSLRLVPTDATIEQMAFARLTNEKYALLIVVVLGVSGAAGGWWYQQSLQRRPLQLWGHDAARLVLQAPRVELWRLKPLAKTDSAKADLTTADGEAFRIVDRIDVSQARGFLHLRHSLVSDHSFDWPPRVGADRESWRYALRFSDGDHVATLLISDDFHHAMLAETGAEASIGPIADGIEELINEQMRDGGSKPVDDPSSFIPHLSSYLIIHLGPQFVGFGAHAQLRLLEHHRRVRAHTACEPDV
jgi:hypothetical protein